MYPRKYQGTVTIIEYDLENWESWSHTEVANAWELDGLSIGESYTETYKTPWSETTETYTRTA